MSKWTIEPKYSDGNQFRIWDENGNMPADTSADEMDRIVAAGKGEKT